MYNPYPHGPILFTCRMHYLLILGSGKSKMNYIQPMKKLKHTICLGLLSLLHFTPNLFSQVSAGIRSGIHISRFSFNSEEEDAVKYLSTPYVSLSGEVFITESFSFQTELIYLQKAVRLYSQDAIDYSDFRMRLNALEIPLLAKKNFVDWSTKLCLYAGPSVAYAFGGKINQDFTEQKVKYTIKESIDFEDMQLKKWDVCLHLGGNLGIPAGNGEIILDARYIFGLLDIDGFAEESTKKVHTRGIGLSIGYAFHLSE